MTLKVIELHLRTSVNPNLLASLEHQTSRFQIDGDLGITAAVAEMLIQSHFRNSSFACIAAFLESRTNYWVMCTGGGIIADITWEKGQLKEAILAIRSDCNQSSQNIESTEICIRCKSEIHHIEENNLLNDTELPWELTEFSRPRSLILTKFKLKEGFRYRLSP